MTNTTTTKLDARARRALDVLDAGGYFRKALERSYTGGEKFRARLYDADRQPVAGIGSATLHALEAAGLIARRPCVTSSTWGQEWIAAVPA